VSALQARYAVAGAVQDRLSQKVEEIKKEVKYSLDGSFFYIKNNNKITIDDFGAVSIKLSSGKTVKIKASILASAYLYKNYTDKSLHVLTRDMDVQNVAANNIRLITKEAWRDVKDAWKNLSGSLKIKQNSKNLHAYVIYWIEKGKTKQKQIEDFVLAKKFFKQKLLENAKKLHKYCIFD